MSEGARDAEHEPVSEAAAPGSFLAVVTTVGSREDARRIARAVVERGLAACAQISEIESVYRWDGLLQQEPEFRLLCKTTAACAGAAMEAIRAMHPYELPAIHAWPVERIDAAYAAWIEAQCGWGDAAPGQSLKASGPPP